MTYDGVGAMAFRVNDSGDLTAFAGGGSNRITIDGREFVFADRAIHQLAWAPVPQERRVSSGTVLQLITYGTGTIRIPAAGLSETLQLIVEGSKPGSRGKILPSKREGDALIFEITGDESGRWIYAAP